MSGKVVRIDFAARAQRLTWAERAKAWRRSADNLARTNPGHPDIQELRNMAQACQELARKADAESVARLNANGPTEPAA